MTKRQILRENLKNTMFHVCHKTKFYTQKRQSFLDQDKTVLSVLLCCKQQNSTIYRMLGYTLLYNKVLVVMQVHTAAIQSLQQQSDKTHCCHQQQRAHHHGTTANNLRTLAAGHRSVVWIAGVRCSIVTPYIRKDITLSGAEILQINSIDKIITSGTQ